MTENFDNLIALARPTMPDPGEYRRLNRVALRIRMAGSRPAPWRPVPRPVVIAGLALLILALGPSTRVETDSHELQRLRVLTVGGEETALFVDPNSGFTVNGAATEGRARELQQAVIANDARPIECRCYSYQGRRRCFVFGETTVEGTLEIISMDVRGLLPGDPLPDFFRFMRLYGDDMEVRRALVAPDETSTLTLFDVDFHLRKWRHEYAGFGPVTFTIGFPADPSG